jgi:isovaleryl-CoA dehydrogenase
VTFCGSRRPSLSPHSFTEMLRRVREVTADVVAPQAVAVDREGRWPVENFRALQSAGLGGLVVPEALGGLGFGLAGLARATEEIALACPSTPISFGMHHVASAVIAAKATPEQTTQFRSRFAPESI